ncbi:MAG: tetratricopeptide repeat protein, partial [Oscillospiraceae bacterium]
MTSKRNIIIIAAAAVILAGGAAAVVLTNNAKSTSESVLALAQRYLSEQKYEQAVIEYQKILDIDPMNREAYLGLAQAYLGMGDTEGAIAALRRGYEATGDEGLLAKLNSLLPPEETQESPAEQQETAELTANVTVDDGVRQMYALVRQECYNADGALTSYYEANDDGTITYCYLESDGWISLKIIYSMNRYGRKDKELLKTYYNDDGTIMLEYIYNEYHDVVQLNSSSTNETWEYTYDDNGNKISALCTRDSHTDDRFYVAPEYDKHIISTSEY